MSELLCTADIPGLPGLGAIRLRAGQTGARRRVRWPYVAENRSFTPWIKGGELVFITGIGRHHSLDNLFELVHEGAATGVAGLVILTGDAYIGQLPAALLKRADALQLPLLEQPYSLPMVTVTEVISRAIIAREQLAWRALNSRPVACSSVCNCASGICLSARSSWRPGLPSIKHCCMNLAPPWPPGYSMAATSVRPPRASAVTVIPCVTG
ncbi:PucR family transcriptional regulator ligand-binding domain-containing protein [Halopseudomonas pachastrellae]|nr:PucR family transcriptional regulator ligand-binding domain-containing protein [Halopseudomonas pachastrellae]